MYEFLYHKILADRQRLKQYAKEGIFKGETFYRFRASFCCQICAALDDKFFSADNPDILWLAGFLGAKCHSTLDLCSRLEIDNFGGMGIVEKGDALLHSLLKKTPYKECPVVRYEFDYKEKPTRKILLQNILNVYRQQYEILDSVELPRPYTLLEFSKNYIAHDCPICNNLRGLYIAIDNPSLDDLLFLLTDECTPMFQAIRTKMTSAKKKKSQSDTLTLKRIIDKAIAQHKQ